MSENKRLAQNTIFLYLRAIIGMLIGLYTSRIVIDVLGVANYGVYGVAGGVVGMLSFLNASMSGASSRFITVALGREDDSYTKKIFANVMAIHIFLAGVITVICETFGLWFLNYKLNIPSESVTAANWVFQLSVLTTAISITQVPYTALIMSRERMGMYAYMEIFSVTSKLVIVYFLMIMNGNKLIIYAILLAVSSFIVAMIYRLYCIRNFSESRTGSHINKAIIKPLLSFSGWDLYGNLCVTLRNQGTIFILNIFFGVAVNGASSIAQVLNGILLGLSFNIITAFRPQIIKNYTQGNWQRFQELMESGSLYSSIMLSMTAIPLILETHTIFGIWLGNVPDYVVSFSRVIIFASIIAQITTVENIGVQATGKIKMVSFITGSIYLIALGGIYFALKIGLPPYWVYIMTAIFNFFALCSNMIILKKRVCNFKVSDFVGSLFKLPLTMVFPTIIALWVHYGIETPTLRLVTVCITTIISTAFMTFFITLNKSGREYVIRYIKSRLSFNFITRK